MIYHKQARKLTKNASTTHTASPLKFQRTHQSVRKNLTRNSSALSLEHQKYVQQSNLSQSKLDPDCFFRNISTAPGNSYPGYLKSDRSLKNSQSELSLNVTVQKRDTGYSEMREQQRFIRQLQEAISSMSQQMSNLAKKNKELDSSIVDLRNKNWELSVANDQLHRTIARMHDSLEEEDRLLISYREQALKEQIKRLQQVSTSKDSTFLLTQIQRRAKAQYQLSEENQTLKVANRTLLKQLIEIKKELESMVESKHKLAQLNSKYHRLAIKHVALRKRVSLLTLPSKKEVKNDETLSFSSQSSSELDLQQHRQQIQKRKASLTTFPNGK